MKKIGGGEPVERVKPMDLEQRTSVEEVNLEGLNLEANTISNEQHIRTKSNLKRKPGELLDNPSRSNESEEALKKRKLEELKSRQGSVPVEPGADELELMCKIWLMDLRRLSVDQQLFARKAVCDVLFEARLGQLNKDSVEINRSQQVHNDLTSARQEHGEICACSNSGQQTQRSASNSSLLMCTGQVECYPRGMTTSTQRPPLFGSHSYKFKALVYPSGPRVGRPTVITSAMNIFASTAAVASTPGLLNTAASPASSNNRPVAPAHQGYSMANASDASTYISSKNASTNTIVSYSDPVLISSAAHQDNIKNAITRTDNITVPTANTSTTPTINTLCDVRMDTIKIEK